jgi:hypothetical protein
VGVGPLGWRGVGGGGGPLGGAEVTPSLTLPLAGGGNGEVGVWIEQPSR